MIAGIALAIPALLIFLWLIWDWDAIIIGAVFLTAASLPVAFVVYAVFFYEPMTW